MVATCSFVLEEVVATCSFGLKEVVATCSFGLKEVLATCSFVLKEVVATCSFELKEVVATCFLIERGVNFFFCRHMVMGTERHRHSSPGAPLHVGMVKFEVGNSLRNIQGLLDT